MKFVAIDWGTSSFRAWLIEHDQVCEFVETDQGVKNFVTGSHSQYLRETLSPWENKFDFIIAIGMIGSSIGLYETYFSNLPISVKAVVDSLIEVPDFKPPLYIVPGVSKSGDVMRGEESQSLAADLENGLVILPGTHSKWVKIQNKEIIDFKTYLTGELFELLRNHSTLSKATESSLKITATKEFIEGLDSDISNLTHDLFSIRAKWLQGKSSEASREYLSGLLVGAEIKSGKAWSGSEKVTIVASEALAQLYLDALAHFGIVGTISDAKNLTRYFIALANEVEKYK